MSKNWVRERKRDYYYRKAKMENYRSRASYKLMQLDERFRIFRKGDVVIDLGASPGGWSQVAAERVGPSGMVVAIDLKPVEPIDGVVFVQGDALASSTLDAVRGRLAGRQAGVVISDMAPNISGNYNVDHARSVDLAGMALRYSDEFMGQGGNLVVKVFVGDMSNELFDGIKSRFGVAKRFSPKASRKTSSEIYMVGKGRI
jgi:23S rRNA (uridine2552-2'-O)-methyltransferase